jgi:transmembrane sensor
MADKEKDIKDFLSGKESEEGKKIFDTWYHSFTENRNSELEASEDVLKHELQSIKKRKSTHVIPLRNDYSIYWKVAAIALIIISAGVWLYIQNNSTVPPDLILAEQIVPRGKMVHLTLSDGTEVWLNADSKFRYPENFSNHSREVYLEGEAFFEVTKDPERPFQIHSDGLSTTVLGTSFNVRSYSGDDIREVAVITGKVSVVHPDKDSPAEELRLVPGEKALFSKQTGTFTKSNFTDLDQYTSWREGKLSFVNAPLSEVISSLERKYNISINLGSDSMRNCRVTAEFDKLPPERIMYLLCYTLKAEYSANEHGFLIRGQGCNQ